MKKTIALQHLDCAHCAAKMERAVRKIRGVSDVRVSALTQRLTLEAEEARYEEILEAAKRAMRKIERNIEFSAPI